MKVPGIVWTTALVFLPLAAGYITEFFSGYEWAGAAAGLLTLLATGIAKVIQETRNAAPEGVSFSSAPAGVTQDSLVKRVLLG